MSDVFISYARSTESEARRIVEALRALGYSVWRDDELPAHRAYSEVIEERLKAAKAVVAVWSAEALKSHWVRAEANAALEAGTLVQLSVDGVMPPMPFSQIQCADMDGWTGDLGAPGWRKVVASISELTRGPSATTGQAAGARDASPRKLSICVLPFANMSADAEQEYFSDGITEDIITDLSKISRLSVVARNTAFTFKNKDVDVRQIARQLRVGHILEGSVRKAANRVRITAQLIDGVAGNHLWADRWDRDLNDIFAMQDEISHAIVAALKLKLLPAEKQAIEQRGTTSAEAYNLYLMARRYYVAGNNGGPQRADAMLRLCLRATQIDPLYARAWAMMAMAQRVLHFVHGRPDDGMTAAERALALDAGLVEAHAVKAMYLGEQDRYDEAFEEIELALRLDPESYEANHCAGYLAYRRRRFAEAARYFETAASLMEADFDSAANMISCHVALGDEHGARRAARMALARAQAAVAQDQNNGAAIAYGAYALAALGDGDRAKEWIDRALLIDPDNLNLRYNLACAVCVYLKDRDAAVVLLGPFFARAAHGFLNWAKEDPDLEPLGGDPRFSAMVAAAEARLAALDGAAPSTA
ncbi:MAG TPA: TIR domain-containing protein [Caulobacteraceae bacterium]